jgi:hypothetical protein
VATMEYNMNFVFWNSSLHHAILVLLGMNDDSISIVIHSVKQP